jgi:hypothetical protein
MKRPAGLAAAVVGVVLAAVGATWVLGGGLGAGEVAAGPDRAAVTPTSSVRPSVTGPQGSSSDGASSPTHSCAETSRPFVPTTISVPGVVARARVIAPPRDARGVPGVPPLTEEGKRLFAWDRGQGIRPGDPRGNVLLNAHTWPDGTALGNRLLGGLRKGDRIVVRGAHTRLCFRVTERVEVSADRPMHRYYARRGPHRLAIVVCSGRRLGPGVWDRRTVWFAAPSV